MITVIEMLYDNDNHAAPEYTFSWLSLVLFTIICGALIFFIEDILETFAMLWVWI